MFNVITFGSAIIDIFVLIKNSEARDGKICFSLGEKIPMEDIFWTIGGGGVNTAATFARQGLKVAWVGKIGQDWAGQIIKNQLTELRIFADFVGVDSQHPTSTSVVLSTSEGRTILTNHQADRYLQEKDIDWSEIKNTQWFYLAPLSGELANLTSAIINFAAKNKIRVAINPSLDQIKLGYQFFQRISKGINVLLLNQEEAAILTGESFYQEEVILERLKKLDCQFVVITQGRKGVKVIDRQKKVIYQAGIPKSDYIDRTGAGDAFGSGLVSQLVKGENIFEAIQYGTANATSCIQKLGAQNGLLAKNEWGKWPKVKVELLKV